LRMKKLFYENFEIIQFALILLKSLNPYYK
jgi:hypothetical protein